jgi:hypothetical protein
MPKLRYLAFGDSYTIGERSRKDRWSNQLAKLLDEGSKQMSPSLPHSWTVDELWRSKSIRPMERMTWSHC